MKMSQTTIYHLSQRNKTQKSRSPSKVNDKYFEAQPQIEIFFSIKVV